MWTFAAFIIIVPIVALTAGYIFGKNQINPNSKVGKDYYEGNHEPWNYE